MHRIARGLVALLVALACVFAAAQPYEDEEYRLGPNDVISVRVGSEPDMATQAPILYDGTISLPLIGPIKIGGMTVAEAEREIKRAYVDGGFFTDAIVVVVNIFQYRPMRVSVVGFVPSPGQFSIRPGDRLLTVITMAGGATAQTADLRRVVLIRRNSQEQIPIDLYAMLVKGDLSQNYRMEDGDVIRVPQQLMDAVIVTGMVIQPGRVTYRDGLRLADAIAAAGGGVPNRSWFSKIQIQRPVRGRPGQYERFEVNYVRFTAKNDWTQNIELHAGDIVYVPETNTPDINRVNVLANILFTLNALTARNFNIFPRF
ncbi:MAG: polysaccharide biosynthesis/export family protein [Armatimonadota bacterium]